MIRIVLDVNILVKMLITQDADSQASQSFETFRCILKNKNQMKVVCSGEVLAAYETLFRKISNGYFLYKSYFYLRLMDNKQLEFACLVPAKDLALFLYSVHPSKIRMKIVNIYKTFPAIEFPMAHHTR